MRNKTSTRGLSPPPPTSSASEVPHDTYSLFLYAHIYTLTGRETRTHYHQYCQRRQRTGTKSSRNKNKTLVYGVLSSERGARRCLCELSSQLMLFTAAATPAFDSSSSNLNTCKTFYKCANDNLNGY